MSPRSWKVKNKETVVIPLLRGSLRTTCGEDIHSLILEFTVSSWQQQLYGNSTREPGAMCASQFLFFHFHLPESQAYWSETPTFRVSLSLQLTCQTLIYKSSFNPLELAIITASLFWNQSRADILSVLVVDLSSHGWGSANNQPLCWVYSHQQTLEQVKVAEQSLEFIPPEAICG